MTRQEYDYLVVECQDILTEASFASRWATIEGWHQLGSRIISELMEPEAIAPLAVSLGKTEKQIERAIKFARLFPVLDQAPITKDMGWYQVVRQLLGEG
jgi:hypothetical protein